MVDITTPQSGSFRADRKLIATLTNNPQLIKYLENLGISSNTITPDLLRTLLDLIINTTDMVNSAQSSANQASNAAATIEELAYAMPGGISAVRTTAPINSTGNQNPIIGIDPATTTTPGSMSAADKAKLDGLTYTEGVWTPTLTMTTPGDLVVAYATREGTWTRIGRMVMLDFVIQTSTFTFLTALGSLLVSGLPFNLAGISQTPGKLDWQGITKAGYTEIAAIMQAGGSIIQFVASGSALGRSNITNGNVTTGTQVFLNCSMTIIA